MSNTKKIFTRTVTFERLIVPARPICQTIQFCKGCGHDAEMVSINNVSAALGIPMRALFRMCEKNQVHSVESTDGQVMICRESLNDLRKGA